MSSPFSPEDGLIFGAHLPSPRRRGAWVREKPISFGKRMLEVGFIKKILLAVYNKIFSWYYS
jgi:hypothetical protein